jgi:hypothetical protein
MARVHAVRSSAVLAVAAVALVLPAAASSALADEQRIDPRVAKAASMRASLGFDASPAAIRSIVAQGRDVGSRAYGFPLTAREKADLDARIRFANSVGRRVVPHVRSLETFGGVYLDQKRGGRLVVLLTRLAPQRLATIRSWVLARPGRGVTFREVPFSYRELAGAMRQVRTLWTGETAPLRVAVDVVRNGLDVQVEHDQVARAQGAAAALSEVLGGVPVRVSGGTQGVEQVCTSRENCYSPLKAGVVIRNGSTTGPRCTMGWHIVAGSDAQWVTAGHCGFNASTSWYHQGLGFVGSNIANLILSHGVDIRRVQMSNSQDSSLVYGKSGNHTSSRYPMVGDTVCISKGVTNSNTCSSVIFDLNEWHIQSCNCFVHGAASGNLQTQGGDSEAPIYTGLVAVGVHSETTQGESRWAKIREALQIWGMSMRRP